MSLVIKARSLLLFAVLISLASCARSEKPEEAPSVEPQKSRSQQCVNLNRASAEELMQLPGIGEVTAHRIVQHRERNGEFRRKEEIIIIDGFSEKKYRDIADKICVE